MSEAKRLKAPEDENARLKKALGPIFAYIVALIYADRGNTAAPALRP
ncbi:hypothetical protein [Rhizobium etli]|nr:hypothetical protein [Rhizobium sp. IE4771]